MNPFMAPDIVGLCPPGVGANKVEPADNGPTVRELLDNLAAVHEAARTISVESVLADLLSLSPDDRSKVKMGLYDATRPVGDPPGTETVREMDQFELMHAMQQMADSAVLTSGIPPAWLGGSGGSAQKFSTTTLRAKADAHRASQSQGMQALGMYAWGYKRKIDATAPALPQAGDIVKIGRLGDAPGT